jgi:gamma-glutamyl:cysteine ligase YbdK (ATP-grasp superfamily)
MPDQPTRLEDTATLAGLVHALVRSSDAGPTADRGAYAENRWAAFRFGRAARLIHPDGTRLATVPELLDELAPRVGAAAVDPVRELDQAGDQLELGRARGLRSLCERLVELT